MCTKKLKIPDIFGLTMSFPNLRVKKQMWYGGQILGCRFKDRERGRCSGIWRYVASSWKQRLILVLEVKVVMFGAILEPGGGTS